MNTHPGIKTAIVRLINNEWKQEETAEFTTADEKHIYNAAQDQILLGHNALEKGYISKHWIKAQQLWCNNMKKRHGVLKRGLEN